MHTSLYIHTCRHIHMPQTHIHTYVHAYMRAYISFHICIHTTLYIYICICKHVCIVQQLQLITRRGESCVSCWLACCDAWTRLCGLTPLVQRWIENPEEECEDLDPSVMLVSKAYHCLVLSLSCVGVWMKAARLSVCSPSDLCASGPPATDLAIAVGAVMAVGSCGGFKNYFKGAQMQIQIAEHLKESIHCAGLEQHLRTQKVTDAFAMVPCL